MNTPVLINTALRLPAPDVEALSRGQLIAAIPQQFIDPGQQFALYPSDTSINSLLTEQCYRQNFLPIAQAALAHSGSEIVAIKTWASCELCQILNDPELLEALSQLSVWTKLALQQTLLQQPYIFLAHLRVYQLSKPIEMLVAHSKAQFVPLPSSLNVTEASPVLSDRTFNQRKHQLQHRLPPLHPELEELQSAIALLHGSAKYQMNHEIQKLLGWANEPPAKQLDSDLVWINTIADLGNCSKKQDQEKSNYQAGTEFENVVRDSLKFLGFTIDYAHRGGAGGLDLFCSKPYPLIGECKAGKSIPNTTAVQLLNLGTLRLKSKEQFSKSAKLIIGPGQPTAQLEDAAKIQGMAIINPETLEKLVKLQAQYRGSVDLFKLKEYLKPGKANDEVEKYIAQVESEIGLRSHLVQLIKNYLENANSENAGIDALHAIYVISKPPQPLQSQELHEILIELASPLTGYLGRIKGSDWKSDRFYFLRDLPTC